MCTLVLLWQYELHTSSCGQPPAYRNFQEFSLWRFASLFATLLFKSSCFRVSPGYERMRVQLMATNFKHLMKIFFVCENFLHMQDICMYLIKKYHPYWLMTDIVTFLENFIFMTISLYKLFFTTNGSLAPIFKNVSAFLTVSCKIWRPHCFRAPWHFKGIKEFEEEIIDGT